MAQQQALAVQAGATALELLKSRRADFARVIPKHMNPERLLRIAEGAIRRNPKLMRCTASSLVVGVMEASCLGLEPGVLGDGWLIPYTNSYKGQNGEWQKVEEAQFQPGYQGIEKLAIRSKSVKAINVDVVYQADDFDYGMGSQPFVKHKPSLAADRETGEPICFYCVVDLVSGGQQITIMSNGAVGKIRPARRARTLPPGESTTTRWGRKRSSSGPSSTSPRLLSWRRPSSTTTAARPARASSGFWSRAMGLPCRQRASSLERRR